MVERCTRIINPGLGAQAVADYFGVKMFVLTSYAESEIIEMYPKGPLKSKRVLYLSFWAEVRPCPHGSLVQHRFIY